MASATACKDSQVTAAMAWRVKYRKVDLVGALLKLIQRIESLGVHPSNRGTVYPTGLRCKSLCSRVMQAGFSKEEVCHQFVAVEETPIEHIHSRGKKLCEWVQIQQGVQPEGRTSLHLLQCSIR